MRSSARDRRPQSSTLYTVSSDDLACVVLATIDVRRAWRTLIPAPGLLTCFRDRLKTDSRGMLPVPAHPAHQLSADRKRRAPGLQEVAVMSTGIIPSQRRTLQSIDASMISRQASSTQTGSKCLICVQQTHAGVSSSCTQKPQERDRAKIQHAVMFLLAERGAGRHVTPPQQRSDGGHRTTGSAALPSACRR